MKYKYDRKFQLTLKEMYCTCTWMYSTHSIYYFSETELMFFLIHSMLQCVLENQINITAHAPKPLQYQQKTGCFKLLTYLILQTRSYAWKSPPCSTSWLFSLCTQFWLVFSVLSALFCYFQSILCFYIQLRQ